jgi:DNA-binding NtrC family response regulator
MAPKLKILLISSHPEMAEPFRAALERTGFAVTVSGRSSTRPGRAPHFEQFALVVDLSPAQSHASDHAIAEASTIDALFLQGAHVPPGMIQSFRNGVYHFGASRADTGKFIETVRELLAKKHLSCQSFTPKPAGHDRPSIAGLIGQSPQIEEVRRLTERLSQFSGVTVLITGETGTGKEVVARLLHYSGSRADRSARTSASSVESLPSRKPFIPVNCGAIPDALFESEFFGHRKGAFTGATADHPGYVGQAQDGALFLDEISSLTLAQQVKLLRFLQDGRYTPVGETQERQSDVTVVAATNEDLKTLVAKGRFREDLYARLKVVEINLPPLCERGEDILLLAQEFLAKYAAIHNVPAKILSEPVIDILQHYHWPQNVRELENLMLALTVKLTDDLILPQDLPAEIVNREDTNSRGYENLLTLADVEKTHIVRVLEQTGFNLRQTARRLGIDFKTLQRRMAKYNIKVPAFRQR